MRKTFILNEVILEKIEKIKEDMGYESETEVVRYCVATTFSRMFPSYIKPPTTKLSIEEKAEREVAQTEAVKKLKADRPLIEGKAFCKRLEGQEDGQYCLWTAYELRGNNPEETRTERQPLIYLSEADCENQYVINGDKVSKTAYLKHKAKK